MNIKTTSKQDTTRQLFEKWHSAQFPHTNMNYSRNDDGAYLNQLTEDDWQRYRHSFETRATHAPSNSSMKTVMNDAGHTELATFRQVLAGLSESVIDGGWGVTGQSAHAKHLADTFESDLRESLERIGVDEQEIGYVLSDMLKYGSPQPVREPVTQPVGDIGLQDAAASAAMAAGNEHGVNSYTAACIVAAYLNVSGQAIIPAARECANDAVGGDDAAVNAFAAELKKKLKDARLKGRLGWQQCNPVDLSRMLRMHVEKGDPRDVANFCMFLWHLNAPISDPRQIWINPRKTATETKRVEAL